MAQLTCKNLTLGYDNRAIQEDLNFSIDAGDYLCIVGENGSGKSTLMKTLLHLQAPISGSIELGDGLKKNEIGYLPQQTLVQRDFPASVREIVLSGCQSRCGWRPFYNKEEKMVAQRAMEKMMIQDLADQCYRELSGGQQQRVALARAIVIHPNVLLMDEPISNLDAKLRVEMRSAIRDIQKKVGITTVYVTHDQIEAMTIGHRIAVLNKGYLQQIDTPEKIYNNPVNIFVAKFIGIPQINILRVNINEGDILFKNNRIKLSDEKRKLIEKRSEVYLGIRPEYVKVNRDKTENSMKGNIAKIENYGSQKCLLITINGEEKVMASVPNDSDFKRYEDVYIKFSKKNMLFFDIATENNIEMEQ